LKTVNHKFAALYSHFTGRRSTGSVRDALSIVRNHVKKNIIDNNFGCIMVQIFLRKMVKKYLVVSKVVCTPLIC
jgi:hypothetical protein